MIRSETGRGGAVLYTSRRARSDLGEQSVPQSGWGRDLGDVIGQHGRRRGIRCHVVLPFRMLPAGGLERPAVIGRQGVQSVSGRQFGEFLLVHDVTPICTRRRDSPSRILVLIVPSGAPTSAAISL